MTSMASKMYGAVTPRQRISAARHKLVNHPASRPYAGVLMVGDVTVLDKDSPNKGGFRTACTNGRDEWYFDEFLADLDDPRVRFLVMHENIHKAYRHLITWRKLHEICPRTAAIAIDQFVNNHVHELFENDPGFVTMPEGGVYDPRFKGMGAGTIFDILYKEHKQDAQKGKQKAEMGGGGRGDGSSSEQTSSEGAGGEKGDTEGGKTRCPHCGSGGSQGEGFDHHDWDGAAELTAEEEEELAKEIDEALRQGAQLASRTGAGNLSDHLKELLQPKLDWREVLREFVTTQCSGKDYSTWRKPNRKYRHYGLIMPSTVSESIESILFAVDVSGSTCGFRQEMYSESIHACKQVKPERIDYLWWDTGVHHQEFTVDDIDCLEERIAPCGGGGTNVTCVSDWVKENQANPQCIVIVTDGYLCGGQGDWGTTPVLWIVIGNKRFVPEHGQVVHVEL